MKGVWSVTGPDQLQYVHSQVRGMTFQIVAGRAQTGQNPGLVSGESKSFIVSPG